MRPLFPVLFLALAAAPAARADDDAKAPKDIIAKAIKAAGAKDDGKPLNMSWKDTGTVQAGGMKIDYTADWYYRGPDALRLDLNAEVMGIKIKLTDVVNGDKVWEVLDGKVQEIDGDKKDYLKGEAYLLRVVGLTQLTHDKEFKLSTVVGKKVNDKPTAAVLVERADRPVITLYFDKETGLLVKSEMMVKDEFQGWKEVPDEAYYEDYKDIGGMKLFSKIRVVRDGKPFVDSSLSDVQTPEKLDPKLFEKPK